MTDETKVNNLRSDGKRLVWKKEGEGLSDRLVQGTVKFGGGSLMFCGCMFLEGPGYATNIDGRMDDELQQSHYNKKPEDVIFQQDKDPKHKSKNAQK